MPQRLHRKHWRERMPPGSKGVARPSFFSNQFDTKTYGPPAVCVQLFIEKYEQDRDYRARVIRELRGKDLWCYCALYDENGMRVPCHADVLLQWANSAEEPR